MNTKNIFTIFLVASSFFATAQQTSKSSSLPKEARTFLESNFKGIDVTEVKRAKEGTTFKYDVTLANGAEIEFNNRGRWREVESNTASLPTTMLQSNVGNYIQQNYPGAKITEIKKGTRFNFVEINDKDTLQFDSEGNFLRIMQ
ncbi:PepSY-like domain-containing protein [Flavobacterium tegetincola]|uniref:PepSY-like domain-containing protein n=1 Tax=Flavobacterium tegetincola TaxID=150172 RepID=UPI00041EDFB0|nr:PepSY-like domain-containing protein [Flavobacterium tegetincola]